MLAISRTPNSPILAACSMCCTGSSSASEFFCSHYRPADSLAKRPSDVQQADRCMLFKKLPCTWYTQSSAEIVCARLIWLVSTAGCRCPVFLRSFCSVHVCFHLCAHCLPAKSPNNLRAGLVLFMSASPSPFIVSLPSRQTACVQRMQA